MSDVDEDLRATMESVAEDAERLVAIERQKAALQKTDEDQLLELSDEAEAIANDLVTKTAAETTLIEQGAAEG